MNTLEAFAMGETNRGKELMVFDWEKAAHIIKDRCPDMAIAGLRGDWEYTGGVIYEQGRIIDDDYTYLASTWAIPELEIDGEIIECYRMESQTPGWNASTKWPESALSILKYGTTLITPSEFSKKMHEIYDPKDYDIEEGHIEADRLMCIILRQLGYSEGVDVFENADRWYA